MINLKEFFNDDEQKIGLSSLGIRRKDQNTPAVEQQKPISAPKTQDAIKANFAPKSSILANSHNIHLNFNNRLIG